MKLPEQGAKPLLWCASACSRQNLADAAGRVLVRLNAATGPGRRDCIAREPAAASVGAARLIATGTVIFVERITHRIEREMTEIGPLRRNLSPSVCIHAASTDP